MSESTSRFSEIKKKYIAKQKSKANKKFPSCCVKNCDEYFKDRIREFEHFPKKPEKKKRWMDALGLETVTWKTKVCDKHFTNKDYGLDLRMKYSAVPSLYLNIVLEEPVEVKSEFGQYEIQESTSAIKKEPNELEDFECEQEVAQETSMEIDIKPQLLDNLEEDPLQNLVIPEETEDPEKIQDFWEQTCRICLHNEDSMIRLFDLHEMEGTVAGLYRFCTGLEIQKNDNFPQHVCKDCFCKLEEACQLKKTAIESYRIFKKHLDTMEDVKILYDTGNSNELKFVADNTNKTFEDQKTQELKDKSKPKEPVKKRTRKAKESTLVRHQFYCDVCEKDVKAGKLYHITQHKKNGAKPIKVCDICERKFYLKADFVDHLCRPSIRNCDLCNINFEFAEYFIKHLEESHFEDGMYVCKEPNCGEKKCSGSKAYHHMRWHKYDESEKKICEICGLKFTDLMKFAIHKNRHHKPRTSYTCDLCGVVLTEKGNLIRHMKVKHFKVKFSCDSCTEYFNTKTDLKLHKIRQHGLEAPYKCNRCDQPFLYPSQLKCHIYSSLLRSDTETYCRTWNKSEEQDKTKEKRKYSCKICAGVFSSVASLWRHRKTVHEKVRPFDCKICEKKFSQKVQLETHTRIHTGEKPFECQICFVRYSDRSTLYKHSKSQHKNESTAKSTETK